MPNVKLHTDTGKTGLLRSARNDRGIPHSASLGKTDF